MLLARPQVQELSPAARSFRSQLLDLPVEFRIERVEALGPDLAAQARTARQVAERTGAAVVLWCDLDRPARVVLLAPGAGEQDPTVRTVSDAEPGARLEALALIVRGSVRAALDKAEAEDSEASTTGTTEAPAPSQPPAPTEPRPWRWVSLELGYGYQPFSSDQPHTHAILLGLAINLHQRWQVLASFRYFLSSVMGRSASAQIRVRRFPVSLGARLRHDLGRLELAAELLATLDYVDAQTYAPGLKANPDQSDFQFTLVPGLRLGLRLAPRLHLFLCAGAEISINRRRYGVLGRQGREQLLDPWPVRPQAVLGLSAELF